MRNEDFYPRDRPKVTRLARTNKFLSKISSTERKVWKQWMMRSKILTLNSEFSYGNDKVAVATDDKEASDKSNIIEGNHLRHAINPATIKYQEEKENDLQEAW